MMAEGSDRLRKEGTIEPQAKISDRQYLVLNVIENRSKVLILCVCSCWISGSYQVSSLH